MKKTKDGYKLTEEEMDFLDIHKNPKDLQKLEYEYPMTNKAEEELDKLIKDYEAGKEFKSLSFRLGNNATIKIGKDSFLGAIDGVMVIKGLEIKGEEGQLDVAIHALKTLKKGAYIIGNTIEFYKPSFFTRFKRAFKYLFNYKSGVGING